MESQLFTRTRKWDPQSTPLEYQLHSALILLITQRSRPRADDVLDWAGLPSLPGATWRKPLASSTHSLSRRSM